VSRLKLELVETRAISPDNSETSFSRKLIQSCAEWPPPPKEVIWVMTPKTWKDVSRFTQLSNEESQKVLASLKAVHKAENRRVFFINRIKTFDLGIKKGLIDIIQKAHRVNSVIFAARLLDRPNAYLVVSEDYCDVVDMAANSVASSFAHAKIQRVVAGGNILALGLEPEKTGSHRHQMQAHEFKLKNTMAASRAENVIVSMDFLRGLH
jgi:hypothetical protein